MCWHPQHLINYGENVDVGDLLIFSGHIIVFVLATSALLELRNCGGNVDVGKTLIFSGKSEEDTLSN